MHIPIMSDAPLVWKIGVYAMLGGMAWFAFCWVTKRDFPSGKKLK
jgi:uncharacterized membrane protein HdeD (DUF308 family)